jgi:hypothetical protein
MGSHWYAGAVSALGTHIDTRDRGRWVDAHRTPEDARHDGTDSGTPQELPEVRSQRTRTVPAAQLPRANAAATD